MGCGRKGNTRVEKRGGSLWEALDMSGLSLR